MSPRDDGDTTVMRVYSAGRSASRENGPTLTEIIVGVILLLTGLGSGIMLIVHHGHGHVPQRFAWFFVGFCVIVGAFCLVPFRLEAAWRELRSALPLLRAPSEDDQR